MPENAPEQIENVYWQVWSADTVTKYEELELVAGRDTLEILDIDVLGIPEGTKIFERKFNHNHLGASSLSFLNPTVSYLSSEDRQGNPVYLRSCRFEYKSHDKRGLTFKVPAKFEAETALGSSVAKWILEPLEYVCETNNLNSIAAHQFTPEHPAFFRQIARSTLIREGHWYYHCKH